MGLNRLDRLSVAVVVVLLWLPGAALGQDDRGASVAAGVSATNMESRTPLSFSGSFAYRFSRVVGLELETTVVPTLKSEFPGVTIQNPAAGALPAAGGGIAGELQYVIYPGPSFQNERGRAVIFSNNVRISIPTTSTRLEPFFVAGGGISSVRHTADYVYSFPRLPVPLGGNVSPPFITTTQRVSSSSVGLALTLGGGLSVRVASQMAVEADLRLFRILGDQDTNVGRFGVGVRYRF